MHAMLSYRGNRHRPPATNTQTHRQDRLQYTAPLASAQCNYAPLERTAPPASERDKKNLQKHTKTILAYTVGARCTIFPKVCMLIELVKTIKMWQSFLTQRIVFPTGCTEKFGLIDRRAVSQQQLRKRWSESRQIWNTNVALSLVRQIKAHKNFEISQGIRPCEATLYQKWNFFDILGPHSHYAD